MTNGRDRIRLLWRMAVLSAFRFKICKVGLRGAIGLQMQNPASRAGLQIQLEWKGGLNDHFGGVLVPAV